jgi:hypothetical protein
MHHRRDLAVTAFTTMATFIFSGGTQGKAEFTSMILANSASGKTNGSRQVNNCRAKYHHHEQITAF